MQHTHPAVFLDRDGVIIENCASYVRCWQDVTFLPAAVAALTLLVATPYRIVIVTNQSVVGRGLITLAQAADINARLLDALRINGGRVDGVYMCPHAPAAGCACRKPAPGLLLQAAEELDIDLSRSVMIGDALSDVAAGQRAGVAQTALVRTGRGIDQEALPAAGTLAPFLIFDNLAHALGELLDVTLPAQRRMRLPLRKQGCKNHVDTIDVIGCDWFDA